MVNSPSRNTWHEDFDRILFSMTKADRLALQRWGLLSPQGRRVFMGASDRLELDIVYAAYVLEHATLAL